VETDILDRARMRLVALEEDQAGETELRAVVDRARESLEALAQSAAELEASMPARVSEALHESLRAEVLPVGRHVAELRGLSAQTIRRLERLETVLETERRARVEDLALLVDLVSSGWRSAERRLDRLDRTLDRLERELEQRASTGSSLRPL
jgi:hypothetical protein